MTSYFNAIHSATLAGQGNSTCFTLQIQISHHSLISNPSPPSPRLKQSDEKPSKDPASSGSTIWCQSQQLPPLSPILLLGSLMLRSCFPTWAGFPTRALQHRSPHRSVYSACLSVPSNWLLYQANFVFLQLGQFKVLSHISLTAAWFLLIHMIPT